MAVQLINDWYFDGGRHYFRTTDVRVYEPGEYQKHNILKIYEYFNNLGWTLNAIAGMIGNMMVESSCNPGCTESRTMDWNNPSSIQNTNRGIGLTQWTPARKFYNWALDNNLDPMDGNTQCARIQYESENKLQWSLNNYGNHTWNDFKYSTETPEILARVFLWAYERPANPDLAQRQANARWVYDWLLTQPLPGPTPVPSIDWIDGATFAELALAYDGQYLPYSQYDCVAFVNLVWHDIPAVLPSMNLTQGTNSLWRTTQVYNTTDPDGIFPCLELWYKNTIENCLIDFGELPTGALLFHQIDEEGPPPIPQEYEGDGIGNFVHVGIYCGNNRVMQSGGQDAGSVPGGGVHLSVYDPDAWNYIAFVVYVDPYTEIPPEPEHLDYIYKYLAIWNNKKKKEVTKFVKRKY